MVVAYGLLLPPAVLAVPPLGAINIHASLLPRWRGAAPIQRAILAGDPETGVSIMRMEAGLDTGPVYLERRVPIGPETDSEELSERLSQVGAEAIVEALEGIAAGTLLPRAQPAEGMTYAAKIDKAEARIDWSRPAATIDAQVRAFLPWPVAETGFRGESLRILRARLEPASDPAELPEAAAGDVHYAETTGLRVRCADRWLRLLEVQRPGRRRVAAAEFGRGLGPAPVRFE